MLTASGIGQGVHVGKGGGRGRGAVGGVWPGTIPRLAETNLMEIILRDITSAILFFVSKTFNWFF